MYQDRSADEAQQLLNQFARTDPDVLWMFSPDWSELYFGDEAYEDLWGRSLDDLIANPIDFLNGIHADDRPRVQDAIDALSDGTPIELECRVVQPETANIRDVWLEGRPVYEDGELTALAGYVRDITERKQYERQLEDLTSFLSHDLRNQLQVAEGHLDLLEEDGESEHVTPVETALSRMTEMTEDVLTLAQTTPANIERESVSLETLARKCWRGIEHGNAELLVEGDTTLHVDSGLFHNVLENLFRNAIIHNDEDMTVCIGPLADERGLYVEDDGEGITNERQETVFEVGHSTGGTGLGLPLVREIVITHGGSITVRESESGGARFELTHINSAQAS
ncbi:PAS domain-containing sensor histidine kinase (plasmid) [Halobacterium salinarum]|uniref:PAS domain-containing sensor histidine kinase n=1 Tax=Halobacterium salinarum TaxID=2242 RepID=UPI0030D06856